MDLERARELLEDDPARDAESAGLRYVDSEEPGYTRLRWGRGFSYRNARGRTIRSRKLRGRFESLVIPPAWTDVWICRDEAGHIQATGRDDAGRKQFIYHERWREKRDRHKYDRVIAFGFLLPRIRRAVRHDLGRDGLDRRRVLAAVVHLLDRSRVRVGNDAYAREYGSYGLTTIRKKHVVHEAGGEAVLEFAGKGGQDWHVEVESPEVVEVISECLDTPGYELFKYFDETGEKCDVKSDDVNEYLREVSGAHVTAKDFRTWAGTVEAATELERITRDHPDLSPKKRLVRTVERVAEHLGNTPAICRSCYIHPTVLVEEPEGHGAALVVAIRNGIATQGTTEDDLDPDELAVLSFLEAELECEMDAA